MLEKINHFSNRKHYIITSTNEIDTYYTFLPSVYQMWKKKVPNCTFVVGFVSDRDENDPFTKRISEFCDELHVYRRIPEIDTGVQAKTTRLYLSTLYGDEVCTFIDIDQYVLDFDWFFNKIAPAFQNGKFVAIGENGYNLTADTGKWPMPYNTAPSSVFKKIVNFKNHPDYFSWFDSYKEIVDPVDNKESVMNPFTKYSDESLLRYIMVRHPEQEFIKDVWVRKDREDYYMMVASRRIDRGWWVRSYSKDRLYRGEYIDSFPLRPFNKYVEYLIPILEYLGLDTSSEKILL